MVTRREFFLAGAAIAAGALTRPAAVAAHDLDVELKPGKAVSPWSGVEYKATPSVCTLCPSRCPILVFTDDGRIAKIQGNPDSERTMGKLCARGQAGVEQLYDPDRVPWPMMRAGKRGEGRWQRISWDVALQELGTRLKQLRDAGTPEKLMLLHGRLSVGTERLVRDVFMTAYGSATVAGPESLGRAARRAAHRLTWGGTEDNWDIGKARFVLNFGSNFLEAHTSHVATARRYGAAMVENGLRMVTFDVRLSNTAARSHEWVPVRPGTDLAVVLAMCQVIMAEGLHAGQGDRFLEFCRATPSTSASVTEKVAALKSHLESYTPEWAETISGVPAAKIREVAATFATRRPACVISHRGASAHWNGVETERAIQMLAAITGNIDNPGGRCRAVTGEWLTPAAPKGAPAPRRLEVLDGAGAAALPLDGVGHHALRMVRSGEAGRPDVLLLLGHNPLFANGEPAETAAVLKDETLLPFTVAVTPFYDETAALADLILPDATYLESWDLEEAAAADQVAEYMIRQPAVEAPLGEARDVKDVICELAAVIGLPIGVDSAEKFVREACKLTPEIKKKARGFNGMKKAGLFRDKKAEPAYAGYATEVPAARLEEDGVVLDEATGVYFNWRLAGAADEAEARAKGYGALPTAARGYVAQRVGEVAVAGFPPDKLAKTGLFELWSGALAALGHTALPSWNAVPAHDKLAEDALVLTVFKVNVQSQGRTQNARYLQEVQHDNRAWLNPVTARERGIGDGDAVRIASDTGEARLVARVTQAVMPGVVAVPAHFGHSEYGRFASGKRAPTGVDDPKLAEARWWRGDGGAINAVIPISADPVAGQQCWMDTVVRVSRA